MQSRPLSTERHADTNARGGHCRKASSRNAARATARPPSNDEIRRRADRTCRLRPFGGTYAGPFPARRLNAGDDKHAEKTRVSSRAET